MGPRLERWLFLMLASGIATFLLQASGIHDGPVMLASRGMFWFFFAIAILDRGFKRRGKADAEVERIVTAKQLERANVFRQAEGSMQSGDFARVDRFNERSSLMLLMLIGESLERHDALVKRGKMGDT